ncbi:MAG: flagellar filament capping protein FliD [Lachnospiraceae bacterium]|nr:flagellar filament capping protein FliD [Lachnospiraceae bacterium]
MNIRSSRNSLLRARNLRSARRSRAGKVISSRISGSNGNSYSSSTQRTTSQSTLLNQTKQLAMYERMEKSANNVQANVEKMLKLDGMTYTDDETGKKAQENDKNNLIKYIKDFVTDYNEVYGDLTDIGGTTNSSLRKSFDSIISTNKTALEELGITVSKSGELTIDEKKLTDADFDKLKALFTKDGGFADKISSKMELVENTASTSLTALNKLYGATSTYNKYGTSNSYFNGLNNYGSGYPNYNYGNYGSNSGWYF